MYLPVRMCHAAKTGSLPVGEALDYYMNSLYLNVPSRWQVRVEVFLMRASSRSLLPFCGDRVLTSSAISSCIACEVEFVGVQRVTACFDSGN